MMSANGKILLALHHVASSNSILRVAVVFFARFFIFFVITGLLMALSLVRPEAFYIFIAEFIIAMLIALAISYGVGYFYNMERPCERSDVKPFFIPWNHWKTFPSDHTLIVFVCAGTVALAGMPFAALTFMACGLLIGTARIMAGVHYPVDIVGGALLGWFVAVVVGMIGQWLQHAGVW